MPASLGQATFRLTYLQVTAPTVIASFLLSVINAAVYRGGLLWGFKFDLANNTFITGALDPRASRRGVVGLGLLDGSYAFYNSNAPAPGGSSTRWDPARGAITSAGGLLSTTAPRAVRLPIFDVEDAITVELPMRGMTLRNVRVPADGGCIGRGELISGAFNECRSGWSTLEGGTPTAELSACITVADAQTVTIQSLGGRTLCEILAGASCSTAPMSSWPRPPDGTIDGMPCYMLSARFAAVSANIP